MITYHAAAGANKVVSTGPAILKRIIVGEDVGSSKIEVSNSPDDGDGNVQVYLEGATLLGVYEIDAIFNKGICADLTNQTNVSFVWEPISA